MEVLIRWRCPVCRHPNEVQCSACNEIGYLERWVPYSILQDVKAVESPFIIMGRREMPVSPLAVLD